MFATIKSFETDYNYETMSTQKLLDALTDASLKQEVAPGFRSLGNLAWHIVTSIPEMLHRTGLKFDAPLDFDKAPASASEIATAYRTVVQRAVDAINTQWTDATLLEKVDMYGEVWPNGVTLNILIKHEVHHRGQLTVLMRQAGLTVPGVYGPAKEEWAGMGMEAPAV